ncbi:hypothetical protein Golob_027628, partial [Gossypium lobatum]|nr:hypothetical protein [Gossypium lobatum]
MVRCMIRDDAGIFFLHLIINLFLATEVPMESLELFDRPTTYMIRDSLYKKFKALQQEQRDEWARMHK